MRTLIVTDIHGNLPALKAVLASPEAAACDSVISLGDHTGFGPQPREVQALLTQRSALMLRGNHEDRLPHAREPQFAGYNWSLLRWTRDQLEGMQIDFPTDHRIGSVLFTHGTPGDPYRLVYPDNLPDMLVMLPEGVTHLVSGHNHTAWSLTYQGIKALNPGSLGMAEDSRGGFAPFAIMTLDEGSAPTFALHTVPYRLNEVRQAYIDSGAAKIAPEMCRIAYHTMCTGAPQATLKLVRHALRIADHMALPMGDPAVWAEVDRTWPWTERMSSVDYWHKTEDEA